MSKIHVDKTLSWVTPVFIILILGVSLYLNYGESNIDERLDRAIKKDIPTVYKGLVTQDGIQSLSRIENLLDDIKEERE